MTSANQSTYKAARDFQLSVFENTKDIIVFTASSRLVGNTFLKEVSLDLNVKEERTSMN